MAARSPGGAEDRSVVRQTRSQVLAMIAAMTAVAAVAWWLDLPGRGWSPLRPVLAWWMLAPIFVVVEVIVVQVHTTRQSRTVSLSELPLVVGLFLSHPVDLLLGCLVGAAAVYVVQYRQTPLKGAFNLALRLAGPTAALIVFHQVCGPVPADRVPVRAWLAGAAAAVITSLLDTVLVMIVVALHDRSVHLRDIARNLLAMASIASVVACAGLVAMAALHADPRTGALLVVLGTAGMAAYQAHARVRERQIRLERLHAFSRAVSAAGRSEQTIRSVLETARDYLRADAAEVVLAGEGGEGFVRAVLSGDIVVQQTRDALPAAGPWAHVLSGDGPVLLPRTVRAATERAQLRALGYRDAIVVPLHDGTGVVGALAVGDRPSEATSFLAGDVAVLQTFADQARLALQHGRLIERLEHETTHDGLTGLPNASAFREATLAALAAMAHGEGRGFALLLVHIDDFAEVNTSLGYQSGEQLVRRLAARLVAAIPPGAVPARVGDDEFGVLLPGTNLPEVAVSVGRSLRAELSQALVVDGVDVQVVVSVGVATAPSHARDVSGLLRAAGCALDDARATPSRVTAYDRDLTPSGQTQLAVLADLRRALERDEVAVYVQPQAHAATGQVLGVEALVRWMHPTLGLLTPDKFLPLAQRHGLMAELTYLVLRRATEAAADWRAAGLDLTMAVNLDPSTLAVEDLPERLDAVLTDAGLPADRLTLEITEDSTIADLEAALAMLRRLRRLGVGLSVDDYGTGYASLSYLRRLPATEVKIDRSFTRALATDEADLVIVRSIIDLAGNLCLRVVAEGVEDQAAWDRLSALGCDLIQGYHLARPMPLAELFSWVSRYHAGLREAGPHRSRPWLPAQRDGHRAPALDHGGPTQVGHPPTARSAG